MKYNIINTYLNKASENSMITLFNKSGKISEFDKKNIIYIFDNNKTLVILDKAKKALFVLDIDYIVEIKIDYPKFEPMSWSSGKNKIKV